MYSCDVETRPVYFRDCCSRVDVSCVENVTVVWFSEDCSMTSVKLY